jgi:hypothetical protein
MKRLWPKGAAFALVALIAAAAAATAGAVTPTVVYDNIPSPQPGNVPSVAFEANAISEWGGQIQLAGTQRQNPTVTVLMSSWGCVTGHWYSGDCSTPAGSTFPEPITLNVYNVGSGGSVGSLIASATQTFNIPFRPSASPSCTGANAGKWFNASDATCYNGFGTPITFNALTGVNLPNTVIVSVAFNTTHYGYSPYGEATACYTSAGGCGYDSLNVGTNPAPTTGSDPQPNDAYLNDAFGYEYCDGGAGGSGTFRLDAGCWGGFQPAIRVAALYINVPKTANDCKNNGWMTRTRADGSTFKNQGDCIQYVNTGK